MPAAIFLKNNMLDAAVCADFRFDSFRHVPTCSILWFLFRNLQAGGASSTFSLAPTKTLNDAGDITADHRDVPAKNCDGTMLRLVLPFSSFKAVASNFRPISVACPMSFDELRSRSVTFSINFELSFDELQVGLRRTMLKFPCYVNRGL